MARWRGLADLVSRLRREVERSPRDLPLRERAAWVTYASLYGTIDSDELARLVDPEDPEIAYALQSRINLSTLAVMSRCTPPTWLCRRSASAVVHGTDLHSIPDTPPQLLRSPGIVEARRPETGEVLWGDYASLGWYDVAGMTMLLGLRYPDGYAVARWTPQWTGEELEPQLPGVDRSPLIDDVEEHNEFARSAVRYLVVLGLLAECDPSPLRIEIDKQTRWRHVYLGERAPRAPGDVATPADAGSEDLDDGRIAEAVVVTGHLKRQRYGPGNTLVKTIYVPGYTARRWFASRWRVEAKTPN